MIVPTTMVQIRKPEIKMDRDSFIRLTRPYRENTRLGRSLHIFNKIFTGAVFGAYPCALAYLLWTGDKLLPRAILVPFIGFICLSVFRHIINRPRPYEYFDIPPVIQKDTKGKSFPSRHVFSATVIGMTLIFALPVPWIGVLMLIPALGLALIRVLSGVHFISDVIAGAAFGVLCASAGFLIF